MTSIATEILSGMMDAFASIISNNLNAVMKALAALTIILLIVCATLLPFSIYSVAASGSGTVVPLVVLIALFIQWRRSDQRTATRLDRAADRDHDEELAAYNNMLAELARRESRGT